MKRKVDVSLVGQRFTVRSDKDEAYVHALANFVTRKFEELQRQTRTHSTHELALLVAMNIADELFDAEDRAAQTRAELRKHSKRMLENLDAALARAGQLEGTSDGNGQNPLAGSSAGITPDDDGDDDRVPVLSQSLETPSA